MKKNVEVSIKGLKCDNPNCTWKDLTISYEDYEKWLNVPCPVCAWNLLTYEDFIAIKKIIKTAEIMNKLPPTDDKDIYTMKIKLNGTGNIKLESPKAEK